MVRSSTTHSWHWVSVISLASWLTMITARGEKNGCRWAGQHKHRSTPAWLHSFQQQPVKEQIDKCSAESHTSFILIDGFRQGIDRLNVQVICGFILTNKQRGRSGIQIDAKGQLLRIWQLDDQPEWGHQAADTPTLQTPLWLSDLLYTHRAGHTSHAKPSQNLTRFFSGLTRKVTEKPASYLTAWRSGLCVRDSQDQTVLSTSGCPGRAD